MMGNDMQMKKMGSIAGLTMSMILPAVLVACGGGGDGGTTNTTTTENLSAEARVGALIFNDKGLSANGQQSCASCHAAEFGHAQNNALPGQFGGPDGDLQGGRTSPSARYLHTNVSFSIAADGTPSGGFFWDGRASSLADQAGGPFLNPVEMANASKAAVIDKLKAASYAADFKAVFGADVFANAETAYAKMTQAIARLETESSQFHPYDSKFDHYLRGKVTLTAQESNGLKLFEDPNKGNCAGCHPSSKFDNGDHPLFTDFTYDNLGIPRNNEIKANATDPAHFDLGLCESGPRTKVANPDLCGLFKVPSLRNVALRKAYFHNGKFKTLKDVVTFYVQRDTHPEKFYPVNADGSVNKFNDLPAEFVGNVNTTEVPYNRNKGDAPALTDAEIDDVVAFLKTLSDGYQP